MPSLCRGVHHSIKTSCDNNYYEVCLNDKYTRSRPQRIQDNEQETYEHINAAPTGKAPAVPGYEYKEFADTNLYQTISDTSMSMDHQDSSATGPPEILGTNQRETTRIIPALPKPHSTLSRCKCSFSMTFCTVLVAAALLSSFGALSLAIRNYTKLHSSEADTTEQPHFGNSEVAKLSVRTKHLEMLVVQLQNQLDQHSDIPLSFALLNEKLNNTATA